MSLCIYKKPFTDKLFYRQDAKSTKKSKNGNLQEKWLMMNMPNKLIDLEILVFKKVFLGALGVLAVNSS
jgi:hypothetical protein